MFKQINYWFILVNSIIISMLCQPKHKFSQMKYSQDYFSLKEKMVRPLLTKLGSGKLGKLVGSRINWLIACLFAIFCLLSMIPT